MDSKVLSVLKKNTHGRKRTVLKGLIGEYMESHALDTVLSCPMGFKKDTPYVISMDTAFMDDVRTFADIYGVSEADVVRIAILEWYISCFK